MISRTVSPPAAGRAIVLGVVQGLTEFAPVSSSGHLVLVPWLLGWDRGTTAFDAALHVGTAAGAVACLSADIRQLLRNPRLCWLLVGAELPAVVVGGLARRQLGAGVDEPRRIALRLGFFGVALELADRCSPSRTALGEISGRQVAGMAMAQAAALAPGVSRSGATITAGRLLGLDRAAASRFSVWMSGPISVGAAVRSLIAVAPADLRRSRRPLLAGIAAAAIAGGLSLRLVLERDPRRGYACYAGYRVITAAAVLALDATRRRHPHLTPALASYPEGTPA